MVELIIKLKKKSETTVMNLENPGVSEVVRIIFSAKLVYGY